MQAITKLIINGQETPCISGKRFPLINPNTGKEWIKVDEADKEDVDIAVKHAELAWPDWNAQPAAVKAATIRRFGELVAKNASEISDLEAQTMGKTTTGAAFELGMVPMICNYMANLTETALSTASTNTPGHFNYTLHEPYGVTAGILPWNGPVIMFVMKVGLPLLSVAHAWILTRTIAMPAVAAGNAIIIKSSEKAPITPLILGKLAGEAGFPPGLIQVLSGFGPTVGSALALHMKIRKISFTGSIATGKLIQQMSGQSNLKSVNLELGGKSPAIIFPDADLQKAALDCAQSISLNAGQVCVASSRIYVHHSIRDEFLKAYKANINAFAQHIGNAQDSKTTHGPQADQIQFDKIKNYLEIGKNDGQVLIGGSAIDREGYFINPTVFTDVPETSSVVQEEIFGPVSIVNTFDTEEEALKYANDTEFGLYASVYTKDITRTMRIASKLEAGMVAVNCTSPTAAIDMPSGGYKQSGLGRELGPNALSYWTQTKSVFVNLG